MRTLECREMYAIEDDALQDYPPSQSMIEVLSLQHCHISVKAANSLLRCFKSLRVFKYLHSCYFRDFTLNDSEDS